MRHRKAGVKLGRTTSHRKAMFRNMVTSLLKHGRIQTTDAKAKALRSWADHVITLAKRGDLHARRQALSIVQEKAVVHRLFAEVSDRFGDRNGGYTRVIKLGRRPGDAAPMALIELVAPGEGGSQKKKAPVQTAAPARPTVETPAPSEPAPAAEETAAPASETETAADAAPAEETAAPASETEETPSGEETVTETAPAGETEAEEKSEEAETPPEAGEEEEKK